jgi:hypothetical protein
MRLCDSIDTLAMAYLDDELATEERHELETHLLDCTACRAEVDTARADHDLLRNSLMAPRASDTMRMRLSRALDSADRDEARAQRKRWSRWALPGGAILAAAAALLVFVGVGFKPPGDRVGAVAKAGVRMQTRSLPLESEVPTVGEWTSRGVMDVPRADSLPGSRFLGWRPLPEGVNGHDAALFAFDIEVNGRRAVLSMLKIANVRADEMSDGDEVEAGGRALRVLRSDGHTAVTCVDSRHIGYMFMADELAVDDLVALVGKTGLVGPSPQE